MKLLKSQIQKTLLDIQEQVLVHYHPALRTADSASEAEEPVAEWETAVPSPISSVAPSAPSAAPSAQSAASAADFLALASWVDASVAKIGPERTRKLVAMRTAAGGLPPDVGETLTQLIDLSAADDSIGIAETAALLHSLDEVIAKE
ncbi:MAG: hypothetical protein KC425_04105 [Anaerolineales bacterium]|nr:hypothetical protein [Anaerolineales bacterium]